MSFSPTRLDPSYNTDIMKMEGPMFGRISILFIVLLLTVIIMAACQQTSPPYDCTDSIGCVTITPEESVKIGIIQAMSGGASNIGINQSKTMKLAMAERNNHLIGHPVVLQTQDELCTAEGGATAALRIIADPKFVGILGTSCSGAAATAGKIMSGAGLVMISGSNSAPSLTSADGKRGADWQPGYFRTRPNDSLLMKTAAEFAFKELGVTRAATINDGDTYTQGVARAFEQAFTQLGGEIVLSAAINKGDTDMKPVLTTVANSGAQFVFFPLFSPEGDFVAQQTKDVPGLEKTIFLGSVNSLDLNTFIETAGKSAVGVYLISTVPPEGSATDELISKYKSTYAELPQHPAFPYAYDAANLLFHAIETIAVQEEDGTLHIGRKSLRDTMYSMSDFKGVSGTISCDEFGDCGTAKFNILRLDDPSSGVKGLTSNILYSYP